MTTDDLAEIRVRAEAARQAAASGTTGTPPNVDGLSVNDALDIFHESAEDVPWLLAEVERLRGALAEQTERADHEDRCAVQNHKNAAFWKREYDRLAATVERVRAVADRMAEREWALTPAATWRDALRAALEGDEP